MNRRGLRTLLALAAGLAIAPPASAAARHALVIGTNRGLAEEPVLEFAESDADQVANAFVAVGSIAPARSTLIKGRPLAEIKRAFQRVAAGLSDDDELWVFVSGHADARGIHIGGEIWSWKDLRAQIDGTRARRAIAFIDACSSGALLTAKGLTTEAPLKLALQTTLRGRQIVSSSGANELSYESRRLRGSPFAHFLVSGLRGAADASQDGSITIAELYSYLYARTVAASLDAGGGPQHPEQAGTLEGAGDWVLAERSQGGGELRLRSAALGTCYVLDQDEAAVLAELRATDPAPIRLHVGRYRVKCLNDAGIQAATVNLGSGPIALESLAFETAPADAMLARGPSPGATNRIGARAGIWLDGTDLLAAGALGYSHGRDDIWCDFELAALARGRWVATAGIRGRVPWWTLGETELDLGLSLGPTASLHAANYGLLFGPLAQLVLPLTGQTRFVLREEILRQVPFSSAGEAGLPIVTSAGLDWAPLP